MERVVICLIILFQCGLLQANDSIYLNTRRIILSEITTVRPNLEEFEWGVTVLNTLKLEKLSALDKSRAIQNYISSNFRYRIRSPRTINSIIEYKGGNCVSHTIMGLFLLRLAGIPAKLCYEFHIRNYSIIDQWRANWQSASHFGASFNSHFWILFFDGLEWQPFDSALRITGFDDFFKIRTKTQRWPYLLSFNPRRMTGAPFIIQMETGTGTTNMKVITDEIWKRDHVWENKKVRKEEWLIFIKEYENMSTNDLVFPLNKSIKKNLEMMSKKWF